MTDTIKTENTQVIVNLQETLTKSEAENKRLREALGKANFELHRLDDDMSTRHYVTGKIIKQALGGEEG